MNRDIDIANIHDALKAVTDALETANKIKAIELLWGPLSISQPDRNFLQLVAAGVSQPKPRGGKPIHDRCGQPIRNVKTCPIHGEVSNDEIVRTRSEEL